MELPGIRDNSDAVSDQQNPVWLMILRVTVCLLGVVGNLTVVFVILVLREYEKAVTHWYVLQLAIADLIFLLTLPFKMIEDIDGEWRFSAEMCKAKEALLYVNFYASVLFLMIMSVDRYVAVCRGFSIALQKFRTKFSAGVITVLVWSFSLLLSVPMILYSNKIGTEGKCKCAYKFPTGDAIDYEQEVVDKYGSCPDADDVFSGYYNYISGSGNLSWPGSEQEIDYDNAILNSRNGCSYAHSGSYWRTYVYFNFVLMFITPLIIMSVCYFRIAARVSQSRIRRMNFTSYGGSDSERSERRGRSRSRSAASVKVERDRMRVTCICLILVLAFTACWLPFHSAHMAKITGLNETSIFCSRLTSIAALVAYLNSAVNPYIYNFIGTRFGQRIRSAIATVRLSVKRRASTFSSDVASVKYHARKPNSKGMTPNTSTTTTKTCKRKSELESSQVPSYYNDETQVDQPLV